MAGFLGQKEVLSRERVREILRNKEYSYIERKSAAIGSSRRFSRAKDFVLDRIPHENDFHRRKGTDCHPAQRFQV
jgi:hypothetical protein